MLRWRYSHATRSNHGWVSFLWRISVFPIFFWQTYAKKSKSNESKLDNYFAIHSLKIVGKPRLIMFILIKNGWHSAVWSTWCSETIKEKRKSKVSSVCSRHVALPRLTFLGFFFAIKMWWFNRLSSLKEFILSSLCTVDCCLSLTDDRNTSYTMQYSCHMPNMQLVFFLNQKLSMCSVDLSNCILMVYGRLGFEPAVFFFLLIPIHSGLRITWRPREKK